MTVAARKRRTIHVEKVEFPAKSGVGGGIVAVVPGKGAIAVFAPPLDEAGNSMKAQKVFQF